MKFKLIFLLAWSSVLVALDQLTKLYIHTHFQLGESIAVLPPIFNFTYVRNFGAAFGFLAESHPTFREIFFLSIPPIAMLIIINILRGINDSEKWQIFALSSIFGGAVGNYVDRLRFGYVIDFLDFHIKEYAWPAFNIADSAIVIGVSILLFYMAMEKRHVDQKRVLPQNSKAEESVQNSGH
jgi:signal peptidase II